MKNLLILMFIVPLVSFSAEVDNFTDRDKPLADATQIINQAANHYLDDAITTANKKGSCDKGRLYNRIRLNFRDQYQDKFAHYVHTSPAVPKRKTKIKDSIYGQFSALDSLIMGGLGMAYDSNAPVLNIHGVQIGGDKFEHFFGMGWYYFNRYYLKHQSIEETLNFGLGTETGILGSYMTGVISYADLSANFKGLLFWNHLLHEGKDLLTFDRPMGPYIKCEEGKWKRTTDVDLSLYIDNGWDEAINCSQYSRQGLFTKVQRSWTRLNTTCPVANENVQEIEAAYGPYASYVLNTKGPGVLKH